MFRVALAQAGAHEAAPHKAMQEVLYPQGVEVVVFQLRLTTTLSGRCAVCASRRAGTSCLCPVSTRASIVNYSGLSWPYGRALASIK